MNPKKIVFIVGPTAVGKSEAALLFADSNHGEIISCDSMQIYKEIRIANNRPLDEECRRVKHHLIGIQSVTDDFDVARFNELALAAIADIHNRGKVPVIVGGSGMYVQVLLDGIFKGGVKNEALRKDLKEQAKQRGNQYLYDKLKEADPKAAEKIHPNDLRRVIRGLEVSITESIPISERQKDREGVWGKYDIALYCLNRNRQELYNRINTRVDQMFDEGIVDEVKAVDPRVWSKTAQKIIGVQEILGYLNKEHDLDAAKEKIKMNTRHLAKRQLTWFKREDRLHWIMIDPNDTAEEVARFMEEDWREADKASL